MTAWLAPTGRARVSVSVLPLRAAPATAASLPATFTVKWGIKSRTVGGSPPPPPTLRAPSNVSVRVLSVTA